MTSDISGHIEKAREQLKSERDSLAQKVKEEISAQKSKALSRV